MHDMQFIFGDHFNQVLAFGDGKRRNGMLKKAVVFNPFTARVFDGVL